MSLLKKHLAPVEEKVWDFIEEETRSVLAEKLTGRKLVDTSGPKGIDYSAYNTGRRKNLNINDNLDEQNIKYSLREVLPLIEIEIPFTLNKSEIEAFLRGARDADIDEALEAAKKLAKIENNAIFYGLEEAGIEGLIDISEHTNFNLNQDTGFLSPLISAIQLLKKENVGGPYNLIIGPDLYSLLYELDGKGYPLKNKIQNAIGGNIIYTEELADKGILIDEGDDFKLVIGQDISIGFNKENEKTLEFFLTESFTFKANAPEAVVVFN
ncbi:MAG: family 1 encapsulin nanocompartment shell protein [Halanaerobiaceae bacterium]